jgi:hypothetical protein
MKPPMNTEQHSPNEKNLTAEMRVEEDYPYRHRYEQLGQELFIDRTGGIIAEVTLGGKKSPAAAFFVDVSSPNARQEHYQRHGTDRYLVVAIGAKTSELWAAIESARIPVATLVLVKAGGFSGHADEANELVVDMAKLKPDHPCKAKNLVCDNSVSPNLPVLNKVTGHLAGWGYAGVDRYQFK